MDELRHLVLDRPLAPPYPPGHLVFHLGMGCFWGAERLFWSLPGVWVTAVGYAGGHHPAPDYRTVCTGRTGHAEVVRVVFDPDELPVVTLLRVFWEGHDPTQGMRQGNDVGSQYRSLLQVPKAWLARARASRDRYQAALRRAGWPRAITTEVGETGPFHFAEAMHQQYLARHPDGYCGLEGTGVAYELG